MSYPPHKAICSSRNKSKKAPNEKNVFFIEKWVESKTPGKSLFSDRGNRVFAESMEKMINVRVFSILRIGQSCHMRSTFDERVFQSKSVFRKFDVF